MHTMRRELTAVSAFSMVISFVAAIVLCIHVAQNGAAMAWQPAGPILWVLEAAIFGTAVYLWRRSASLGGWVVGIVGLVLARLGLTMFCAFSLSRYQPGLTLDAATVHLSAFAPRGCAIFFSLMICYPLRAFLPAALLPRKSASEAQTESTQANSPVWMVENPERAAKAAPAKTVEEWVPAPVLPGRFGGVIDVPLHAVISRIPGDLLSEEAQQYPADLPVSVPLFLIGPQIKEAAILVRLADLRDLLPPQVLAEAEPTGLEGEPMVVSLALEDVIPALPAEALELPPPSPPAWAGYPDPDGVVFATV